VRTPTGEPKPKKLKANKEVPEASTEATAYAKAMQSLADMTNDAEASQLSLTKSQKALYDLMVSPAWKSMPDAWKETSAAQFKAAYAAETAADHTKRLNELLADTESSGIEKAQSDMRLLITAMEKGIITEEKYAEAIKARFEESKDGAKEAVNELDEFAKSAARNIQDSLADFLFDPFADGGGAKGTMVSTTGTSADVYPMLAFGKEAWGQVALRGQGAIAASIIPVGQKTKDDPLAQRGYVGWKGWHCAVILNQLWMARLEVACTAL